MRFPRNPALLAASVLAVAFTAGARQLAAPKASTGQPTLTDRIGRMCDLWDKGDWGAAMEELDTIMKMFPHGQDEVSRLEPRRKADFYFVFAAEAANQGQNPDAVKTVRNGLRLKPDDALAHYFLGTYIQENDGKLKEFNEAIRLKPDFADAYCLRSICLKEKGDMRGATTDIETAMRLNPRKAYDYAVSLASALNARGDLLSAISLTSAAARANPADTNPHRMLELLFEVKNDWASALAEAREWVRLKPDDPDAHQSLGRSLMRKGDIDGSIAELREAIHLDPDVARYHSDLSMALKRKGDVRGASQQEAIATDLYTREYRNRKRAPQGR